MLSKASCQPPPSIFLKVVNCTLGGFFVNSQVVPIDLSRKLLKERLKAASFCCL